MIDRSKVRVIINVNGQRQKGIISIAVYLPFRLKDWGLVDRLYLEKQLTSAIQMALITVFGQKVALDKLIPDLEDEQDSLFRFLIDLEKGPVP